MSLTKYFCSAFSCPDLLDMAAEIITTPKLKINLGYPLALR